MNLERGIRMTENKQFTLADGFKIVAIRVEIDAQTGKVIGDGGRA